MTGRATPPANIEPIVYTAASMLLAGSAVHDLSGGDIVTAAQAAIALGLVALTVLTEINRVAA